MVYDGIINIRGIKISWFCNLKKNLLRENLVETSIVIVNPLGTGNENFKINVLIKIWYVKKMELFSSLHKNDTVCLIQICSL